MKTRTGKIARLPKPIREQLNQRLENGEPGTLLVTWLNQLPEVQKIITDQFAGLPIRPQNLSEWRKGGYLDWIRHQLLREQTRWTAEQADDLGLDTTGKSISIAEDIATVMSAELAIHVQTLSAIKNSKQRFQQFRLLSRELSRLRRDDHHAIRTQLRCNQSHSTPDLIEQGPEIPESESLPSTGGASVLASRPPLETNAPELTEPAVASDLTTCHPHSSLSPSKTLRATRKPRRRAPASRTAVALYRYPKARRNANIRSPRPKPSKIAPPIQPRKIFRTIHHCPPFLCLAHPPQSG